MIKIERQYMGTTVTQANYREILEKEGREGINFHEKHLKAYLKGFKRFTFGWIRDEKGQRLEPKWHIVKQKITNKVV